MKTVETLSFAEREAERISEETARAERWEQRVKSLEAQLKRAASAADASAQELGPLGQPILRGHHSEKSARTRHKRHISRVNKVSELMQKHEYATSKHRSATIATSKRYTRAAISNKITSLSATLNQGCPDAAAIEDELSYWRKELDTLNTSAPTVINRETVEVGDLIRVGRLWYMVARTNAKTVTVWLDKERGVTSDYRHRYESIDELRRPSAQAA